MKRLIHSVATAAFLAGIATIGLTPAQASWPGNGGGPQSSKRLSHSGGSHATRR